MVVLDLMWDADWWRKSKMTSVNIKISVRGVPYPPHATAPKGQNDA
jgi:hypothetical protein